MIWKKGKYLKTSTMVTVIFMQSVMEIALLVKKLYPLKTGQICQECDVLAWQTLNCLNLPWWYKK
jgi:hypothetical protein